MKIFLKNGFFDVRSIGLFRIILSIGLIFQHVLIKWPAWDVFFSESGCLNQTKHLDFIGEAHPSIFLYIHDVNIYHGVMAIALLSYLCLLLGIKTKYTSLFAIFFYWSVNQHLVFLSSGWDMYGMCMLTIALLLPLDQSLSVFPSKYRRRLLPENQKWIFLFSVVQISLIYITSTLTKTDITWLNGTAFENVINDRHLMRWFTPMLLQSPPLLKGLNYATLILEFSIGILVLLYAFLPNKVKILPSLLIFLLHFGIFLLLDVEPFIFFAVSAATLLLPGRAWKNGNVTNSKNIYKSDNVSLVGIPKYVSGVFIVICIVANLHSLSNRSYIKGFLQKTKIKKVTSKIMSQGIEHSSFINQTWDFYSLTIPDMGCISIVAELNSGEKIDMLSLLGLDHCEKKNYFAKKHLSLTRIYTLNDSGRKTLNKYANCLAEKLLSKQELEQLEKVSIEITN